MSNHHHGQLSLVNIPFRHHPAQEANDKRVLVVGRVVELQVQLASQWLSLAVVDERPAQALQVEARVTLQVLAYRVVGW